MAAVFFTLGGAYFFIQSTLQRSYEEKQPAGPHAKGDTSHPCMPYRKRLKHYCHQTLLEGITTEFSREGSLVQKQLRTDSYELLYAHIVLRHGDRTPTKANQQLSHPKVNYKCSLDSKDLSSNWEYNPKLWDNLNDFPLLAPIGNARNGLLSLHPGSSDQLCRPGDLTSKGFLQHLNLGNVMQAAYGQLLSGIDMENEVYAQSTEFRRTIRSAGAFLLGFIPDAGELRQLVKIHVQPGTLNQAPPETVPETYQKCKNLLKLREAEKTRNGYYTRENYLNWMKDEIFDIYGISSPPTTPWTDIFDHFMTRGCHSLPSHSVFPCTKDGDCVDCVLGKQMFDYADWCMSEKFPSNSSLIATLPFIKHSLLDTMERIMAGENTDQRRYKIMLTFTHDSMINQLMKALGIHVKEWIPYASRLSFELWRDSGASESVRHFVRVLFNGRVVTHALSVSKGSKEEIIDYSKWKDSIMKLDVWSYNKLCDIS